MDTVSHNILLLKPNRDLPLFAAFPLVERWGKVISQIETELTFKTKTIEQEAVLAHLATLKEHAILIFSDWIVDDMTVEHLVELSSDITDDQALFIEGSDELLPLFSAGKDVVKLLSSWDGWRDNPTSKRIKDFLQLSDKVEVVTNSVEQGFWAKITDDDSVKNAEWGLLKLLQFRPGGVIAKYCNRPFSIRMTRHLLKHKWITANLVTVVDFFIGLIALSFFLIPGYWSTIVATLLLQLNSIVDGVDGEIARLRKESSVFGANLDSLSDETIGALLYPAIGYHLMISGQSHWFFVIGIITGVISYTYAMINFHSRYKSDNNIGFYYWWDQKTPIKTLRREPTVTFYLKHLLWRESILFGLVIIAFFGVLDWFILFAFLPALVNAALVFIHIFIKKAPW